jgi:hypothetical protein
MREMKHLLWWIAASASAVSLSPPFKRTPFGVLPTECIVALESGSRITPISSDVARVTFPNYTTLDVVAPSACAGLHFRPRSGSSTKASPAFWDGWPNHFWFGQGYTTRRGEFVWSLNATWAVPPYPHNTLGNGSDPYSKEAPTESWWVGIQGPTVLQPVLELNGLMPGVYDAASWNCCPAGMAWHSTPLPAQPGDTIVGGIVQVAAVAEGGTSARAHAAAPTYSFVTNTTVKSAGGESHSTTLYSDMDAEPGWAPTFAEAIFESYFVTRCDQFPCSSRSSGRGAAASVPTGFSLDNITLYVTPAAAGAPVPLQPIPWLQLYEVDNSSTPGVPVCGGESGTSQAGETVSVWLNCSAAH